MKLGLLGAVAPAAGWLHSLRMAASARNYFSTRSISLAKITRVEMENTVVVADETDPLPKDTGRLASRRSNRAKGLKDISVFLGPHGLAIQHPENMKFAGERMVAFARAAALGRDIVEGSIDPDNLRELVISVPNYWQLTTDPRN